MSVSFLHAGILTAGKIMQKFTQKSVYTKFAVRKSEKAVKHGVNLQKRLTRQVENATPQLCIITCNQRATDGKTHVKREGLDTVWTVPGFVTLKTDGMTWLCELVSNNNQARNTGCAVKEHFSDRQHKHKQPKRHSTEIIAIQPLCLFAVVDFLAFDLSGRRREAPCRALLRIERYPAYWPKG